MTTEPARLEALIEVSHLTKNYTTDDSKAVLGDLSLSVAQSEFACIVGPSGAGKTTLLKCLAGLLARTSGRIRIAGEEVVGPPKRLGLVFQDYSRSLLPWLTVVGNVALPLRGQGVAKAEAKTRAIDRLEAVGLADAAAQYPWQLSGGMQQRVAIARALAYEPQVLLMDEPFASVDAQTRMDLEDLILSLRDRYQLTILLVTHDIDEAVYLADTVVVISGRPASVLETLHVDLPQPRDQITTKSDRRFVELRNEVLTGIRGGGTLRAAPALTAGRDSRQPAQTRS